MFQQKNVRAAQNFVESLREALERGHSEASAIVQEERRLASRGATDDHRRVLHAWEKDLTSLQGNVAVLTQLADTVPSTSRVLECGVAGLDSIDEVLDRFERRLQAEFGLPPVHVSLNAVAAIESVPQVPSFSVMEHVMSTAPPSLSHAAIATPVSNRLISRTSSRVTPSASTRNAAKVTPFRSNQSGTGTRRNETDAIPKTPRMEDFGLDADVLRALQAENNEYLGGLASGVGAEQYPRDIDMSAWDGDNFKEGVQDSMRKIGIDLSQTHLTDEFDHRRHIALRNVLASSTPKLNANTSVGFDYSQLAAGYSSGNLGKLSSRGPNRELSFDDDE